MNLRQKLNYRILACLCVLLFFGVGLIAYSTFRQARQIEKSEKLSDPASGSELKEEETESREPGLRFRRLSLQDAKGVIDPNGLRNAREQIDKMKQVRAARNLKRADQIQEAAVIPESWTWLGPGNIGGRIRSISIHPNNVDDILVGSVSGGIWRTFNGAVSWFPVDDFMANLAVTTLVRNPTNSNILYAGTGEGFAGDGIQGAGIFRSNDGGATWTQLGATNNADFNTVNRLAISPNGTTVLAGTSTGVWRSTDSGATWNRTLSFGGNIQDIDFNPTDSNKAIAARNNPGAARYSTDGGLNWQTSTFNFGIEGRIELAYAPSNPQVVYASVDANGGDVYRSNDGGETYSRVNTGNNLLADQGFYDNIIWVNPQDANFVIVGGVSLWRSTNGGTTFSQISNCNPTTIHADHHVIVAHPTFNNITNRSAFFGNDGGIYRAENVATVCTSSNWIELNNESLGITQFYGAAGNNQTGTIIGGTQDNGTLKFNGGTGDWTQFDGNDGGYCAADQTNNNYFYGEIQNMGVFRSNDAGQSRVFIVSGLEAERNNFRTNFIAPLVIDNNEPNRLLAGGWSLWRTNDARGAAVWNSIKVPTGGNSPISAIVISPNNSDFIVVGHNNGDVFFTFDGTANLPTWSKIDTAGLPDRFVTRLVIDTTRAPNWIYATFGGFSADNVYVSKNLGTSWTDITGTEPTGLPDVPVRSLVIHPFNPNLLYVGTEVGIYTSGDAGATWDLPNGGPANVSVDELFWMGGDLIAATHGRGLYRASGGLYVDCNYNGVQLGSFDKPFKTVNAAINALTSYRPIWLKPCTYTEQVNTFNHPTKKFEIRSLGGTVTVQAP